MLFDQWVAGYAHGVSGGITTAIRREDYGEIQEGDHAFLWNMGNLAGISTSFILGFQVAAALAGQMGATKWGTTFARGWEWVTGGYGIYQAGMGLADGQWDYTDVFNLLSLVPYAVPAVTGVANSLGTMRAANRAASGVADDVGRAALSVDDMLRSSQKTQMATDLPNSSACFVAGTEILTPEGEKDIEDIKVGDWVIADDPTTPGEIEKRQVLQTFVRETDVLVDLYVDGEVISTTEEHPFWVPDKGWVEAGDLQVGDLFQTEDGVIIDLDGVERREGEFEVYNFEVEDFHTYFVSDLEILVHNANCDPKDPWGDVPANDLEELGMGWNNTPNSDPIPDAITHIQKEHSNRWKELGLKGPDDLPDFLDNLYENGEIWIRPDQTTAHVDPATGNIFINNPKNPTVFNRPDYESYLTQDGFRKN